MVTRKLRRLEELVDRAAAAAIWITAEDRPKVELALTMARRLDDAVEHAERKAAGTLFGDAALAELDGNLTYHAEVLGRMLDSLGLSPKGRRDLGIDDLEEEDELTAARRLHLAELAT